MTIMEGTPFILVVDGDADVVLDEVQSLEAAGWNVEGTTDPWKALQRVAATSVCLVVVDLDLPGPGGSDFCAMIQDDPGLTAIPMIFLSKHAALIGSQLASFHGPNVCLPKPFNGPALVATVRNLLACPIPSDLGTSLEPAPKSATRFVRRRRDRVTA